MNYDSLFSPPRLVVSRLPILVLPQEIIKLDDIGVMVSRCIPDNVETKDQRTGPYVGGGD